jgi:hypothetical protein
MNNYIKCGLILLAFLPSKESLASPTACSFYNETRLSFHFWGCAEPTVNKRVCNKVKGICPACVRYKGDRGKMYMPDFFVEVTKKFGKSNFDHYPSLAFHLNDAKSHYGLGMNQSAGFVKDGASSLESNSQFWHVRILQPPFGTVAFPYFDMPVRGVVTAAVPTCFQGISEYVSDQWNFGISDMPFAAAWAPLGIGLCNSPTSSVPPSDIRDAISSASGAADIALGGASLPNIPVVNCAFAQSGRNMMAMNLRPSSDALSFSKLCMRSFGNLIPRQGHQETGDQFVSAIKAAWKFLSLAKDIYPHAGISIEFNHKWQLVYPRVSSASSSRCFKPGSPAGLVSSLGPLEAISKDSGSYIFALWRPRNTTVCYEPDTAEMLWKKRIKNIDHNLIKTACRAIL